MNLRPQRGGFLRPLGCGWFIREFLAGRRPVESPKIDPSVGAPMVDIHYQYKMALMRTWAEDMVTREEEKRIRRKLPPFTPEETEQRTAYSLERIPMKFTCMRYSSFTRYFGHLKRLGWVEESDKKEPSAIQDDYPPAPPRVYYRLTSKGRAASLTDIMNPLRALYPQFSAKYFRAKCRHYSKRR